MGRRLAHLHEARAGHHAVLRRAAHRTGPPLDDSSHDIGVVTSIVGLSGATFSFVGRADHAGTTPMNMRQDALRAAADFLNRLQRWRLRPARRRSSLAAG
jgi:acetylornithine deacetylase/succinyl-diaminopimelate desuccinylase-like protein